MICHSFLGWEFGDAAVLNHFYSSMLSYSHQMYITTAKFIVSPNLIWVVFLFCSFTLSRVGRQVFLSLVGILSYNSRIWIRKIWSASLCPLIDKWRLLIQRYYWNAYRKTYHYAISKWLSKVLEYNRKYTCIFRVNIAWYSRYLCYVKNGRLLSVILRTLTTYKTPGDWSQFSIKQGFNTDCDFSGILLRGWFIVPKYENYFLLS